MRVHSYIIAFILAAIPVIALCADPVCEFENPESRRISGDNPSDFACIKLRAAAGDEFQQYYLGLILIGQIPGPTNIQEGLAVLKEVARRNNKYSADAMRSIGGVYKQSNATHKNYALAYQWLYLASQQPPFKGTAHPLPDEQLNAEITPERMMELERSAPSLLQER